MINNIKYFVFILLFLFTNKFIKGQCPSLITNAGNNKTICAGQSVSIGGNPTINNNLLNSSVSYSWSPSTNISSSLASNPSVYPNTTTKYYLYVQQTDSLGVVCNALDSVTINVNPLPNVTLNNFSGVCISSVIFCFDLGEVRQVELTLVMVYLGILLLRLQLELAPIPITYTYINGNGCSSSATSNLAVNPLPNVTLSNFSGVCINSGSFILSGGSPNGGTYSGSGVVGNSFNPSIAGIGPHSITYSYTDLNGCSSSTTKNIVVNSLPSGVMVPSPYSIIDNYNPNNTTWTKCQLFDTIFTFSMKIQPSSVQNNSPTTKYDLVFGNGDTAFNALPNISYSTVYTYELNYNLELIITDTLSGCSNSFNRDLFWGKNAQVILSEDFSMGNSGFCAPVTLSFPVVYGTPSSPNSPGTSYTIQINDGTSDSIFTHPFPSENLWYDTIYHTFNYTSCGAISYLPSGQQVYNSFSISILAQNLCPPQKYVSQGPYEISDKPVALIKDIIDTISCQGAYYTFIDSSKLGYKVLGSQCDSTNPRNWIISPDSGYVITSGSIGQNRPDWWDPFTWGSDSITLQFNTNGDFEVLLLIENVCGGDSIIDTVFQKICIDSVAHSAFTVDNSSGCFPLNIQATNSSKSLNDCDPKFLWEVRLIDTICQGGLGDWSFDSITDSSSIDAGIIFNFPGFYEISLKAMNDCDTAIFLDTIKVQTSPIVNIDSIIDYCDSVILSPIAVFDSCESLINSYQWTFYTGSPSSSTLSAPNNINFFQLGTNSVVLQVTNQCGVEKDSIFFDINPSPIISLIEKDSICIGNSVQLIPSVTSGTPNFTYSWSVSDSSLSSYNILSPFANPITIANYSLLVSDIHTCQDSESITIEVLDLPTVAAGPDQSICYLDTALFNASISGAIPPYSFTWSPVGFLLDDNLLNPSYISILNKTFYLNVSDNFGCTNSDTISIDTIALPVVNAGSDITECDQLIPVTLGGTPSGGVWSGSHVTSAGVFTPNGLGQFVLTYSFTDVNGCVNTDDLTATVVAPSDANAGLDIDVCIDTGTIILTGSNSPNNGLSGTGLWSGNGITVGGQYTVSTVGVYTFTYSYGTGTCLTTDDVDLTVNPLPVVDAGLDVSFCIDAGVQTLLGSPLGGVWSGSGVSIGGDFDPGSVVSGTYTLTYRYTDGNSCVNSDTRDITVNELPVVNAGSDITECDQLIPVTLGGTPSGGVWSGSHVTSAGVFTPNGLGQFVLTYSFTDVNGCVNTDDLTATVVAPSDANAGLDIDVCIDTGTIILTGSNSPNNGLSGTGLWSGNGITVGGQYTVSTVGVYTFTYSYGTGTCLTTDDVDLTVNPLPVVDAGLDVSFCIDAGVQTLLGSPLGGVWSGSGVSIGGDFDPGSVVVGTYTLTYRYTDGNSCVNSDTRDITVNGLPVVNAGSDITECDQLIPVTLGGTPGGGVWSGSHVTSAGVFTPNGVGTFVLTYTYTDVNGCVNTDDLTATVVAPSLASAGLDLEVCIDAGTITLVGSNSLGGSGTGLWSGNGITSGGQYTVSTVGVYTFTYSYGSGTCLSTNDMDLTVHDLPVVDAGLDVSFCIDAGVQTLLGSPLGGVWSGSGVSIGGDFDPSSVVVGMHTLTYTYTDGNSCVNSDTRDITVNGLPVVNAGSDITECDQLIPLTLGGTPGGGLWSGSHVTSAGVFTPNGVGTFVLTYTYTDVNGCVNTDDLTATVVAPSLASAGLDLEVCIDAGTITLVGSNSLGGSGTGLWSGNGITSGGQYTVSTVGVYTFTYSYGSGTCLSTNDMDLTVHDLPVVDAGLDVSFCIDAGVQTLLGSPLGGVWSGSGVSIGGDFDPSSVVVGMHTLTYTYTDGNSCVNSDTRDITVNGLPVVNAGSDITECDQLIPLTLGGTPGGGLWSGSHVTSAGVFTPNGVGTFVLTYTYTDVNGCVNTDDLTATVVAPSLASAGLDLEVCIDAGTITLVGSNSLGGSGTGLWSGNGITSGGQYTVSTVGVYTFTYSYGSGTCLSTNDMDLTVHDLPVVDAGLDVSFCIDAGVQTLLGSPLGGVWSGSGVSIGGDFDPSSVVVGMHTLTYTYTDGNSCVNSDTRDITVNGLPVVNAGSDITECDQLIPLTLGGTPGGGLWSGSHVTSAGVFTPNGVGTFVLTYTYTDVNGCVNTDDLTATVVAPSLASAGLDLEVCIDAGTITLVGSNSLGGSGTGLWSGNGITSGGQYTVSTVGVYTFTYSYGSGTCLSTNDMDLTVHDLPVVDAGLDVSFCIDAGVQTLLGSPLGGVWSGSGVSIGGDFDPSSVVVGMHTLTYTYTDGNSCVNSDTRDITVNGLPVVNAGSDITECDQLIPLTLGGTPGGGLWSGSHVTSAGVFTPNGVGTFVLTYTYTDVNGCVNTDDLTATVVAPSLASAGLDLEVCIDAGTITLVGSNSLGGSGTGLWSGNGITSGGQYTVSTVGVYTFTYSYGSGTCLSTNDMDLTVHDLPVVDAGLDVSFCIDAGVQTLLGSPLGGVWSGSGVSIGGDFDPSSVVVGMHTLTYTYTDGNSCVNSDTRDITVNGLPVVNAGSDITECDQLIPLTLGGTPGGGLWSGSHVTSAGVFTPNGVGTFVLTYTYTDVNGCVNTDDLTATVVAPSLASAGLDLEVCIDAGTITLVGSNSLGGSGTGLWSGNGITSGGQYTVSTVGVYTFTYSYGSGTCLSTNDMDLTVHDLPVVDAGLDVSFCIDAGVQTLLGSPLGGVWSGSGVSIGGDFDPSSVVVGMHTLTYTYTDGNSCVNSDTRDITVNGLPVVNAGSDITECDQLIPLTLGGTPGGGLWSGSHVTSAGVFTPNGVGTFVLTYTYTDVNGCVNTDDLTATVVAPSLASAGLDLEVCIDAGTITLVGSNSLGGSGTGLWSGNGITSGGQYTVSTVGVYTFTYSYGSGTCLSTNDMDLTVHDLPVVDAGLDVSFCIDAGVQTLLGSPLGGVWSGSGVSIGGDFDPGSVVSGTYTLTYRYTDGNSCVNSDTRDITVNELPVVNAGSDITECDQLIPLTLGGTPGGGLWSGSHVTSAGVFTPNGVGTFVLTYTYTDVNGCVNTDDLTATVVAPSLASAGLDLEVCIDAGTITLVGSNSLGGSGTGLWSGNGITSGGQYTVSTVGVYTFTYSYGSGTCLSTNDMDLTVHDLPVVDAGLDVSFCIDAGVQTLLGSPLGGVWSGSGVSIGGDFDPGSVVSGTYTLTYRYTDGNSCVNSDTRDITVNELPVVNAGSDITECDQLIPLTLGGTPGGGLWSGSHVTSAGVFTPNGVGTFVLTYTYTDVNGCVNTDDLTATVVAPSLASAGLDLEVCIDAGTITLVGSNSLGGSGTGLWSGNGITSGGQYTVSTVGVYTFTYSYGSGTCLSTNDMDLTVHDLPVVDAGLDVSFCIDAGVQTLLGSPLGGVWSGSGVSIGGDFDPSSVVVGMHTLTYTYTDGNSCVNSDTRDITVNGLPVVNAGSDITECDQLIPLTLGGTPGGGLWSGSHVTSAGVFTPNGVGTFVLTYTYTDVNGCVNTDDLTATVVAPSLASAGLDLEVCIDAGTITLVGSNSLGGSGTGLWSGNGITSGGQYTVSTVGVYTFTYSYGSGTCLSTNDMDLTVHDLPVVDAGLDVSFCIDAGVQTLLGSPLGGVWSGSGVSIGGDFSPATAQVGVHTLTYYYLDSNSCDQIDTREVTVNGLPLVMRIRYEYM